MISKMESARTIMNEVDSDVRLRIAMKDRLHMEPNRKIDIGDELHLEITRKEK